MTLHTRPSRAQKKLTYLDWCQIAFIPMTVEVILMRVEVILIRSVVDLLRRKWGLVWWVWRWVVAILRVTWQWPWLQWVGLHRRLWWAGWSRIFPTMCSRFFCRLSCRFLWVWTFCRFAVFHPRLLPGVFTPFFNRFFGLFFRGCCNRSFVFLCGLFGVFRGGFCCRCSFTWSRMFFTLCFRSLAGFGTLTK